MRTLILALTLVVIAPFTQAAPLVGTPPATPLTDDVRTEIAWLRQAYAWLQAGNHNYHGHRYAALKSVGAACKELGAGIKGDGDNRESQKYSDSRLAQARENLVSVQERAEALKQEKVLKHVNAAIKEIDAALANDDSKPSTSPKKK